jgi:hypothetical protein
MVFLLHLDFSQVSHFFPVLVKGLYQTEAYMYITCNAVSTHLNHKRIQMCLAFKKSLQEKSLDIGRALKSVTLGHISLDCKANVEQFNHQCFERSFKWIYEPLDIEVEKSRIKWNTIKKSHHYVQLLLVWCMCVLAVLNSYIFITFMVFYYSSISLKINILDR